MKFDPSQRFVSRLTRNTQALILAGGRGSRLHDLTTWRAKPAVPFGGKFRIIDFPLSNCVNSGIRRISVLTQYKAHSLIRHIQQGWGFLRGEFNEYVALLPAQQRIEPSWYKGTADAVYQNLDIIQSDYPSYILILAGDHIYKMDYGRMVANHAKNDADLTVGCIEVPLEMASGFGVMEVDKNSWIKGFEEKPKDPRPIAGKSDQALASMGIYVFNTDYLVELLTEDAGNSSSSHDFGIDIIPIALKAKHKVLAYPFQGVQSGVQAYWRDVGTVDAYWQANLELTGITPELNLYENEWPIWTYQVQAPPAKFIFDDEDRRGMAVDSMVSGGCIISGATVRHSLLFSNVVVESHTLIQDSVILPDVTISESCRITRAIIDSNCYIPPNTVIGEDAQKDAERFYVSPKGIVLVTREMLGQETHYAR